MELNLLRDVNNNKKGFCRYTGHKREAKEGDLLVNEKGELGHLCAWENRGADPPGSYVKAHVRSDLTCDEIWDSQHGFTEVRSCLNNMMAFYDGVTTWVKKRRELMSAWICASSFAMVLHHILIANLERDRFEGWTRQWIKKWLDDCSQRVVISSSISSSICVMSSIHQRSVLGPVLLHIFINDPGQVCEICGSAQFVLWSLPCTSMFVCFGNNFCLEKLNPKKSGLIRYRCDLST